MWSAVTSSLVPHTLADNQLRPGAEASRADARGQRHRRAPSVARQALASAETTLTRVLGVTRWDG